jgi:hypothetical protein
MFLECIEKARLPDFRFSGTAKLELSQRRLPKQKNGAPKIKFVSVQFGAMDCEKSSLNRSASGVHPNDSGKAKMEILVNKGSVPALTAFILIDAEPVEVNGKEIRTVFPAKEK